MKILQQAWQEFKGYSPEGKIVAVICGLVLLGMFAVMILNVIHLTIQLFRNN